MKSRYIALMVAWLASVGSASAFPTSALVAPASQIHYNGYAGTPTITGSISGNDLLLATNGLIGKDIAWLLRVEQF